MVAKRTNFRNMVNLLFLASHLSIRREVDRSAPQMIEVHDQLPDDIGILSHDTGLVVSP